MKNSDYHVIMIAGGRGKRLEKHVNDKPKSFLEINGKKIIDYHLDILNEHGFTKLTIAIGYLKELFMSTLKNNYKGLSIDYAIVNEYATSGHGWGTFLTRQAWEKERKHVIFMHGDIFYDPLILDKVLSSEYDNVLSVDNLYKVRTNEEVVVQGKSSIVSGIKKGIKKDSTVIGELIGVNKWSAGFMKQFYDYMDKFFKENGINHNYEPILENFIKEENKTLNYIVSDGLGWVNINHKKDHERAEKEVYPLIYN